MNKKIVIAVIVLFCVALPIKPARATDLPLLGSNWHDFQLFQTSLGGIIAFNLDSRNSISAFIDYNLG